MKVFAPGKLVLTGAYAVLGGAPAIVMATSRGAYADGSRSNPTPTAEVRAALGDVDSPHVDASSLFLGSRKLGLGASAAILVASLAAREAARGADLSDERVRAALFDRARGAHASAQSGGSGVDVAASVHGGVLEYVPGVARVRSLPNGTRIHVFACGTSARTSELRGLVDRLASLSPATHATCIDDLASIAHEAAGAVKVGSHERFVVAVRRAARALSRLGVAANAPIVPVGFDVLEDVATAEDAAFCVSGAGGGDVAVYVGSAPPSPAFVKRALELGLFEIDVALDEKGVRAVTQSPAFVAGPAGAISSS
ncbi:MAG: Phosphomevalonate kinase [Labilithrix sp.]|nr:Phosphomevalonate kinase [Labilithrix sp.]